MDLLARKPGVSDAQVCASAERQEAVAIVVGGSVDECGANNIRPVSASVSRESCIRAKTAEPTVAEPAPCGPVVDPMPDNPTDRALFQL